MIFSGYSLIVNPCAPCGVEVSSCETLLLFDFAYIAKGGLTIKTKYYALFQIVSLVAPRNKLVSSSVVQLFLA
jgi:hypothetical protein